MLVKFFKYGLNTSKSTGGNGVKDYLLGKDFDNNVVREKAKLLRGAPSLTTELINGIEHKKIYTSGCLSFEEKDISNDIKEKLMNEFEETLFPSSALDKDQYSGYWVEHQDKDRLELNFVFANQDLNTNKSLPVYWHKSDLELVNAWKDIKNIEHDFTSPYDNMRTFSMPNHLAPNIIRELKVKEQTKDLSESEQNKIDEYEFLSTLQDNISDAFNNEVINNRDELIELLENSGCEISRKRKDRITIKNPITDNKPLAIIGVLAHEEFKDRQYIAEYQKSEQRKADRTDERLSELTSTYNEEHERRSEKLKSRFDKQLPINIERHKKITQSKLTTSAEASRETNADVYQQQYKAHRKRYNRNDTNNTNINSIHHINSTFNDFNNNANIVFSDDTTSIVSSNILNKRIYNEKEIEENEYSTTDKQSVTSDRAEITTTANNFFERLQTSTRERQSKRETDTQRIERSLQNTERLQQHSSITKQTYGDLQPHHSNAKSDNRNARENDKRADTTARAVQHTDRQTSKPSTILAVIQQHWQKWQVNKLQREELAKQKQAQEATEQALQIQRLKLTESYNKLKSERLDVIYDKYSNYSSRITNTLQTQLDLTEQFKDTIIAEEVKIDLKAESKKAVDKSSNIHNEAFYWGDNQKAKEFTAVQHITNEYERINGADETSESAKKCIEQTNSSGYSPY